MGSGFGRHESMTGKDLDGWMAARPLEDQGQKGLVGGGVLDGFIGTSLPVRYVSTFLSRNVISHPP